VERPFLAVLTLLCVRKRGNCQQLTKTQGFDYSGLFHNPYPSVDTKIMGFHRVWVPREVAPMGLKYIKIDGSVNVLFLKMNKRRLELSLWVNKVSHSHMLFSWNTLVQSLALCFALTCFPSATTPCMHANCPSSAPVSSSCLDP